VVKTAADLIKQLQRFPPDTPVLQYANGSQIYHSAPTYLASMKIDRSYPSQANLADCLDGKEAIII
jgi:hypothetical protein